MVGWNGDLQWWDGVSTSSGGWWEPPVVVLSGISSGGMVLWTSRGEMKWWSPRSGDGLVDFQ